MANFDQSKKVFFIDDLDYIRSEWYRRVKPSKRDTLRAHTFWVRHVEIKDELPQYMDIETVSGQATQRIDFTLVNSNLNRGGYHLYFLYKGKRYKKLYLTPDKTEFVPIKELRERGHTIKYKSETNRGLSNDALLIKFDRLVEEYQDEVDTIEILSLRTMFNGKPTRHYYKLANKYKKIIKLIQQVNSQNPNIEDIDWMMSEIKYVPSPKAFRLTTG